VTTAIGYSPLAAIGPPSDGRARRGVPLRRSLEFPPSRWGQAKPSLSLIEQRVLERATRVTAEQVEEACSFARAERILGREYHGRFLIELLQNAADAWRATREGSDRTDVRIVLSGAPALLVANKGTTFPASAVVESLGHIGRSTKAPGEAIGHKGIGFKSVLELTLCPELYSGLSGPQPTVAALSHMVGISHGSV